MSGRCTGWVLRHGPRDRAMRAVLITVADAANADGEHAHPGTDSIVEGSLYARATVFRVLRRLEEEGWIEVEEKGGGRGRATVYRVLMDDAKRSHGETDPPEKGSHPAPETVSSGGENSLMPLPKIDRNGLLQRKDSQRVEDEARALCTLLADQVEANGCKRPTVGPSWLDSARLLLTRDHRPPREAAELVRWATADEFWRANVLSMPTFRRQYDKVRLSRARSGARAVSTPTTRTHEALARAAARGGNDGPDSRP